jgi:cytochrome c nitrite reductase small subunit
MRSLPLVLVLPGLLGVPAGVGAFTFVYAKGYSYLSTDPRTCLNCHIMSQQYDAWRKSGHRHTATCVECHLPNRGIAKWVAKADQGFRHSLAFTLQNFPEPIKIIPRDRLIVRANCVRCHESFVHAVVGTSTGHELDCLHCHATAGHGAGG